MSSRAILSQLSSKSLVDLHENSGSVDVAQVEISEDFLREETVEMASSLAGSLLFFVDMGNRSDSCTAWGLSLDGLLEMLALLTGTSEKLHEVVLMRSASFFSLESGRSCRPISRRSLSHDSFENGQSSSL